MNVEVWVYRMLLSEPLASMMVKSLQKIWEGPCWEGMWPFSGSLRCCGLAHDSQHLECPEEVWAARRALLLPCKERTRRLQGDGGLWALYPSGE